MKLFRQTLLLVSCILAGQIAFGQSFIGLKGGLHLSTFSNQEEPEVGDYKLNWGGQGGLIYHIGINDKFAIQPEILFIQKGLNLKGTDEDPNGTIFKFKVRFVMDYLEVPVHFKYTFGDPDELSFYAMAGPSVGYALQAFNVARVAALGDADKSREEVDLEDLNINRVDVSASFGGGMNISVDPGYIFIDVRALIGLSDINEEGVSETKISNRGFGISLGYMFPLGASEQN